MDNQDKYNEAMEDPGFNLDLDPQAPIIKVVGVGGGGGNAVNHMYTQNIQGVSFVVCNTDRQHLNNSPVPCRLLIGPKTCQGLGAGNDPEVAKAAAEESEAEIASLFDDTTKMVFITAGMGGGTGTGAAPVVARIARDKGVLTVGIVTIPFLFEGNKKILKAINGADEMSKYVDAILIINNERLTEIYPDLDFLSAFGKADDTLSVAAKSIAEIITVHGLINLDFNDVKTVLKDGGVAIMSTGFGEGDGRVKLAIEDALNSPLLNDNDIFNAKRILLSISFHSNDKDCEGLMMDEMSDVNDFMDKFGRDFEIKWGLALDPTLGEKVKVTILATGFGINDIDGMSAHRRTHQSQEEIAKQAAEEEARAKRNERRDRYYGPNEKNHQYKSRPQVFLFEPDDLDNEDVILAVENTPTAKRTRQQLEELSRQSRATKVIPEETIQSGNIAPDIIHF